MQHEITVDHLSLKLPHKDKDYETSPLCLTTLQCHRENALLAKDFDGETQPPLDAIQQIVGVPFHHFKRRTASRTNSYRPVFTFNNLVDITFRKFGDDYVVDTITVHGRGWGVVPYSADRMILHGADFGLELYEIHHKIDIPANIVSWDTIEQHFNPVAKAFTCTAVLTPFTGKDQADGTKITGYRAGGGNPNSYAVSFYPSWQKHLELPPGTWRIEVQSRGVVAQELMRELDRPAAVLSLIKNRINFRSLTQTNKNRSERSIPRWWTSMLQGAGAFRVARSHPAPDLERRKDRFKSDLYSRLTALGRPVFLEALEEFVNQFMEGYQLVPK